jgi:hypothetical protein
MKEKSQGRQLRTTGGSVQGKEPTKKRNNDGRRRIKEGREGGGREGGRRATKERRKEGRKEGKKFDKKRESLRCTFSKHGRIQNKPHPINKARDLKDTVVARCRTGDGQGSALAFVTVKRVGPD